MSNFSAHENLDHMVFFRKYMPIYIPYSLMALIGCIVGLVGKSDNRCLIFCFSTLFNIFSLSLKGNALIILAVLIHKDLRKNPTCILITNLGITFFKF